MRLPYSTELAAVLSEAKDIADATDQRLTSAHVLLAIFTVENPAATLLVKEGVSEDTLLDLIDGKIVEGDGALDELLDQASRIAAGFGARDVAALHLLIAMTRVRRCFAQLLLEGTDLSLAKLRTRAVALLTRAAPSWSNDPEPVLVTSTIERAPSPTLLPSAVTAAPRTAQPKRTRTPRPPTIQPSLFTLEPDAAPEPKKKKPKRGAIEPPPPLVSELPRDAAEPWLLQADDFPWLTSLGRNLSAEAARGRLDELVARDREIEQLIDILGKRRANNPCLLGEPGVGKTAVVEGLALRLVRTPPSPQLGRTIIVELDVGSLLVGTHLRGSFSEKLQGLKEEVRRSRGRVLVFFDELHTLVGAGSAGDGALDAANELKAVLARGEFPCIGATTFEEWKKHVEPDPALVRRFDPVLVKEPTIPEAIVMIGRIMQAYAQHHGVAYADDAVEHAVKWSVRYIPDRHLPDKAIAVLDLAGSRAARAGRGVVDRTAIAEIVAERAEIPLERVLVSDRSRLLELERHLAREIVGHAPVLARIAEVVRRNAAGFGSRRPQGSFLFLGPTGVGKTETAKALAKILHGSEDALVRFDLSEFSEPHSVARLVGAPPGYVGFDGGGQLTESVRRRPASIILFDEVEKAHRDVLQVFLQILDDGRLTDGRGRTVSFAETIVILTSNLGADRLRVKSLGFQNAAADRAAERTAEDEAVLGEARRQLAPELWARIEEKLVYRSLGEDEVREVARRLVRASSDRLFRERGIRFALDDAAIGALIAQGGFDVALGARPMRQVLSRVVESRIASRILEGRIHAGDEITVSTRADGGIVFLVGDDATSVSMRPAARTQLPRPSHS
jgi:ATP-dependent Clp protease ATP-binding subunit ClpC